MLTEIYSPAFKQNNKERPPIKFNNGLNVVLGMDKATNSIGKSSMMLVIDFVFGGSTYLNSDGVKHIGSHTIFFAFKFDKPYYFARSTEKPDYIFVCNKEYNITGDYKTKKEYVDWLKEKYNLDFHSLSFRETLGTFFRAEGKENCVKERPLQGYRGINAEKSIMTLVYLYNKGEDIAVYRNRLLEEKERLTTFKNARKHSFISNLVGGKDKFEENLYIIKSLEQELLNLRDNESQNCNVEDIQKNQMKSELKGEKLRLETRLEQCNRREKLLSISLEYGLYPTEDDLGALQEYFPDVNLKKIYEVENYHKKLARILDNEFSEEKVFIQNEIEFIKTQLEEINTKIEKLGFVGNLSKEFLDKHSELNGKIRALKEQNEAFLTQTELQETKNKADASLKKAIDEILFEIQDVTNKKMKEFNTPLFTEARKAPILKLSKYNSYSFGTPDDTGTGTGYKSLILFDLATLFLTELPAIAHDSLLFKNIEDETIEGIMKIYNQVENINKQIFISFDKQGSYGIEMREIIANNVVLSLTDNGGELYGISWNKEEKNVEDKL